MALSDAEIAAIKRWVQEQAKTWPKPTPEQTALIKRVMGGPRKRETPAEQGGGSNDHSRDETRNGSTRAA